MVCAVELYERLRRPFLEEELIDCLRNQGLTRRGGASSNVGAALEQGFLLKLRDARRVDPWFSKINGRGFVITIRGLLVVRIINAAGGDKRLINLLASMIGVVTKLQEAALLGGILDAYRELVRPPFVIDGRLSSGERGFRLTLILRGEEPNERERRVVCEGTVDAVYKCLKRNMPIVEEYIDKIDDKIKNILSRHIAIRRSFEGEAIPVRPDELDDYIRDVDSLVKVAEYLMAIYNMVYTELETAFRSLVKEVVRRELGEGGQA
jgi:hypothetical protein